MLENASTFTTVIWLTMLLVVSMSSSNANGISPNVSLWNAFLLGLLLLLLFLYWPVVSTSICVLRRLAVPLGKCVLFHGPIQTFCKSFVVKWRHCLIQRSPNVFGRQGQLKEEGVWEWGVLAADSASLLLNTCKSEWMVWEERTKFGIPRWLCVK